MTKLIDIIIPAYRAKETLPRCLCSIGMQRNIQDCSILVINDGDSTYENIINNFKPYMDIQEIILDKNYGAGYARQIGLENSKSKYVMFLDADDTLVNATVLSVLIDGLEKNNAELVYGHCYVETPDGNLINHNINNFTLHGKVYRRRFLDHYGITFDNLRANEDTSFQGKIHLLLENLGIEPLVFQDNVMIYHNNPNSITSTIDTESLILSSFDSILYVLDFFKHSNINLTSFILGNFMSMFLRYNYLIYIKSDYADIVLDKIKSYYKLYMQDLDIRQFDMNDLYSTMVEYNLKVEDILVPPAIIFDDFLNLIGEDKNDR